MLIDLSWVQFISKY